MYKTGNNEVLEPAIIKNTLSTHELESVSSTYGRKN